MYVYADNAASAAPLYESIEAFSDLSLEYYSNPSSKHRSGVKASEMLNFAKNSIAWILGVNSSEIYFTSGGTESDNLALLGMIPWMKKVGRKKIVTSQIEHSAILETCKFLESVGFDVVYLPVDKNGFVDVKEAARKIDKNTGVVSIMYANNEVGSIQPVAEIAKIARDNGAYFHTDAVQAFGKVGVDIKKDKIQMMSISGHKIGAPKGIGILYVNKKVPLNPMLFGGGQQNGLRSGTENLPGVYAIYLAISHLHKNKNEMGDLARDTELFVKSLRKLGFIINSPRDRCVPGIVNFAIPNVSGDSVVLELSAYGIMCSSGSACHSDSIEPSHVLMAMGRSPEYASAGVRMSFSTKTTKDEFSYIIRILTMLFKK